MKFFALLVAAMALAACANASSINGDGRRNMFGNFGDRFEDIRNQIQDRVQENVRRFSKSLSLDKKFGEFFTEFQNGLDSFAMNTSGINNCFESEMNGFDLNIFNSSLDMSTVSSAYYVCCCTCCFSCDAKDVFL